MRLKRPFGRITIDPEQLNGQPCIRGMRFTVRRVLLLMVQYPDRSECFRDFPERQGEDLKQALEFQS